MLVEKGEHAVVQLQMDEDRAEHSTVLVFVAAAGLVGVEVGRRREERGRGGKSEHGDVVRGKLQVDDGQAEPPTTCRCTRGDVFVALGIRNGPISQ